MLVGFSLYSFIDIRILPINQWFKIYMYNIFISIFDVMIYNTSTKHGCLDLALDPHRFLSSPLILSDSHSQRIYFVLFNILPKKKLLCIFLGFILKQFVVSATSLLFVY